MARRFHTPQRVERSTRIPVWIGAEFDTTTISGSSSAILTTLNAAALALRPFTIIRHRILIHIESDQAAASEILQGAYGKIVVEEEAQIAGVAAVPKPLAEPDAPWMVYQPLISSFLFGTGVGFVEPGGVNVVVDSKAMRKVGLSETLISVVELGTVPGGIIGVEGRILIKLH